MTQDKTQGPLAGIRVIDVSAVISGPLATMILGDQGADVIKIEAPGMGDIMRFFGPMRGGIASTFVNLNRSKRSVVINLRTPDGKALLYRLVEQADVFVQNFRPGVTDRMGFGYDALAALNPDLVYVSISGFGESGPLAGRKVYDNVIQALSGVAAAQAHPQTGEPDLVRNLALDKATAYTTAQAITAALFARERGAGGQHVRVNMLDVGVAFLWPDGMMQHTYLEEPDFALPPLSTVYRLYHTQDGHITLTALNDAEWQAACRALGRPEMAEDPRYSSLPARFQRLEELHGFLEDVLRQRSTAEWCARFEAEDVPHARVVGLDEVHAHPQVLANGSVAHTSHPLAGPLRQPAPAARFGGAWADGARPAPALGEHTDEVLAEYGIDPEERRRLREAGIIS